MNIGIAYQKDFFDKAGATVPALSVSDSFLGFNCPTEYGITANSVPDYDQYGPDCAWSAQDWINWHKKLIQAFGKEAGDSKWVVAYDKATWGSKEIGYSTGNPEFKSYILSAGLDKKSTILSKVFKAEVALDKGVQPIYNLGNAVVSATEIVDNAAKAGANATEGISNVAKYLPWILVAGVVVFGYFFIKSQTQTA